MSCSFWCKSAMFFTKPRYQARLPMLQFLCLLFNRFVDLPPKTSRNYFPSLSRHKLLSWRERSSVAWWVLRNVNQRRRFNVAQDFVQSQGWFPLRQLTARCQAPANRTNLIINQTKDTTQRQSGCWFVVQLLFNFDWPETPLYTHSLTKPYPKKKEMCFYWKAV